MLTTQMLHYLRCSALQFFQTILQALHFLDELIVLTSQQALVERDLLQEALWCGIVVTLLIHQVLDAHLIHGLVAVGQE